MKIHEILALNILAGTQVVAGEQGLEREVRWVHILDLPDLLPWVQPGQLLLTTGYAWPRQEEEQRALVRALTKRNLAGVGLAIPQYFEHFSQAAREEADIVHLPLLEIPWDIPFARITEDAHRAILAEQYRVIERSEAIHRALTRAALELESLQDLAVTLGSLIGRTVAFTDEKGRPLAIHTPDLKKHESAQSIQSILKKDQCLTEIFIHLENLGHITYLQATNKPLHLSALAKFNSAECILCPIRLQDELAGIVWIIEDEQSLNELDMRAAEHAAVVVALHIAHQRELSTMEARFGSAFLDSLLEGRFESTPSTLERARLQGFDPDGNYHVGLLILDEPIPLTREGFLRREHLIERLRQHLRILNEPLLLTASLNQIPFLLSERCKGDQLWQALQEKGVSLAFGMPHKGIEGVRRSYREVLSLLPYLPAESYHSYETLLLPRVLSGEQEARQAFLDSLLGKIQQQRNGETLCATLLTWAQAGFRSTQAAEQLNIHTKTLQYRLTRASEIAHLDLSNPDIRFHLQLAAHLLSFCNKNTT